MSFPYPNQRFTSHLGLSLFGMEELLADNFNLIDAAYGAGSSINVDGTLVTSPNLSSTLPVAPAGKSLVTWQFDANGNISAYITTPGPSGVTSWSGDGSVFTNVSSVGAVTATLGSQPINKVFAGPSAGLPATPTFRALVAADIPALAYVTSVAMTGDGVIFNSTVTGSPITTSGTLAPALLTQSANVVLAGPTSGGAATPTFRALVTADIPNSTITPLWSNLQNAAADLTLANAGFKTTFNQTSNVAWLWDNTTVASNVTTNASPTHVLSARYWDGAASQVDSWTIGTSLVAGSNGASTLRLMHSGSTGAASAVVIGNSSGSRAGALQLLGTDGASIAATIAGSALNSLLVTTVDTTFSLGNARIFTVTSQGAGTNNLTNTTTATVSSTLSSPLLNFNTKYWNGAASQTDAWTLQSSLAAGTNGASTLSITHSGSTGAAGVTVPKILVGSGTAALPSLSFSADTNYGIWRTSTPSNGLGFVMAGNSYGHLSSVGWGTISGGMYGWTASATDATEARDTGISRLGAASLAIGNGTASDTTGNLSFNTVIKYGGTATVSQGIPSEIVTVDLTAQTAAIGATNIIASAPRSGMYRISWSATITTAATTSSVLGGSNGFQIGYTSPTDSVAKLTVPGNSITTSQNTTATSVGGCEVVYAKTGTAITYQYDYTSVGVTAMAFELHLKLESM